VLKLCHQSYNDRRVVSTNSLCLSDLQHGGLSVYQPIQRYRQTNDRPSTPLQPETQREL